MTHTS